MRKFRKDWLPFAPFDSPVDLLPLLFLAADRRLVQFTYLELAEGGVFMTAQIAGNEVVYSILLRELNNPLNRKEVESRFERELLKK
jgi:hypothetical protein